MSATSIFNTLRNKRGYSLPQPVTCSSLTFKFCGKAADSLSFMLMGMLHSSTAAILWLSAFGRSLDVLPFASRMKSLVMKLEENVMLSGGDT